MVSLGADIRRFRRSFVFRFCYFAIILRLFQSSMVSILMLFFFAGWLLYCCSAIVTLISDGGT